MTAADAKGPAVMSPAGPLSPESKSKGRRPKGRILVLVVGVGALATGALTYTVLQREQAMKAQSATSPVDGPSAAGATMPHDLYDAVPSNAVASAPAAPQKVGATDGAVRRHALGNRSKSESDLSKEYARLQAQRLAAARAALTATDEVQSFRRNDLAARTTVQQGEQVPITHPNFVVPPLSVGQGGVTDANGQAQKNGFIAATAKAGDSTYLAATRTPPVSATEVRAGTVIPAVMVSGINSDLPGQIVGQVSRNVYDSASGNSLLIPAGAKVIGTYDSSVTHGQKRVLVAWTRIIFPDGSSISLGGMPGADQGGYAGFRDQVNTHFWAIFGDALLMSVLSAGAQISQPQTSGTTLTAQQIMTAALGQQFSQVGASMVQKNMNIQPTLKIRPGYQFNVMVTKDIILPPWRG